MELIALFTGGPGAGSGHTVYRDPATGICARCPVGSDWGDGDWPPGDERWERLGQICDQSGPYSRRATRPDCPIALVDYHLRRYSSSAAESRAMYATAERLAAQRLDPERVESIKWFEKALKVERDRLAFLAEEVA